MSGLFRRSSVFADIQNVVVSTDAIVGSRLKRYFELNSASRLFFIDEIEKLFDVPAHILAQTIMANKKDQLFLIDYFDWSKMSIDEDINPIIICRYIYKSTLELPIVQGDILENPDISGIMTSMGKSFKVLCADANLNNLYLYRNDWITDDIIKGLNFFYFGNNKIKFVSGDKGEFLKETNIDSYFFEDVEDIDKHILFKHYNTCDVMIPGTSSNLTIIGQEGNTRLRVASTTLTPTDYKNNYNLEVHTIGLPI